MNWSKSGDWGGDDAECDDAVIFNDEFVFVGVHQNDPADGGGYYLEISNGDPDAMIETVFETELDANTLDEAITLAEAFFTPYNVPTYLFGE